MKTYLVSVHVSFEIKSKDESSVNSVAEDKIEEIRQRFAPKFQEFIAECAEIEEQ